MSTIERYDNALDLFTTQAMIDVACVAHEESSYVGGYDGWDPFLPHPYGAYRDGPVREVSDLELTLLIEMDCLLYDLSKLPR